VAHARDDLTHDSSSSCLALGCAAPRCRSSSARIPDAPEVSSPVSLSMSSSSHSIPSDDLGEPLKVISTGTHYRDGFGCRCYEGSHQQRMPHFHRGRRRRPLDCRLRPSRLRHHRIAGSDKLPDQRVALGGGVDVPLRAEPRQRADAGHRHGIVPYGLSFTVATATCTPRSPAVTSTRTPPACEYALLRSG